ncbi:MAG: nitrite/sulfite reductase [Clostridiaceae bacterium]
MLNITEDILKSIEVYEDNLQKYKDGVLDNFKSFSAFMGIYKERLTETYMIRPRIPGGVVTLEQLKVISNIAKKYGENKVRFTTRQDIQFHSVKIDYIDKVLNELIEAGLTTKGAGGDSVRNVACSPLSGVSKDDVFDVTPYMKEVANYMLVDPSNLSLPRKYKISFSNSPEDTVNATVSDIGFIAKVVEGKRGFEVYIGGGLGGGARVALKIEDFIEEGEALYYVQALREVFAREGDRTNRSRARLRFVRQRIGDEEFVKVFREELKKVKAEENLKLNIKINEDTAIYNLNQEEAIFEEKYKNIVFPQKQKGYYSLYIHPQNGNMITDDLDKVLDYLSTLNYEVSIRLSMTQGFYVRDLKVNEVRELINITKVFSSRFNIENSITCAGPTICNFGINHSQGLLYKLIETFKDKTPEVKDTLPRIFLSGCHNSCGAHQKGLIGLTGRKKRTEDGMVPTYTISFNGMVGANIAKFGEVFGEIPAKKLPDFFLELSVIKACSNYKDFTLFIENNKTEVKALIEKYSVIESLSENPDIYSDFI